MARRPSDELSKGERTRAKIIAAADATLRERGLDQLGVAAAMKEAGLTVGGFYAHFESRTALAVEALRRAFAERREDLEASHGDQRGRAFVEAFAGRYLSMQHRGMLRRGCPLPSNSGEIGRQEPEIAAAFREGLAGGFEQLAERLPEAPEVPPPKERAQALMALCLGGLILARALPEEEAEELLAACRAFALAAAPE